MNDRLGATRQERSRLNEEFDRTADSFASRTHGRFDRMNVVEFSQFARGQFILEVGSGTGNFLALFEGAGGFFGVDLTMGMVRKATQLHPDQLSTVADGARLPFRSRSFDLVTSAQTFHHIPRPAPVLKEMRRVMKDDARMLVVDQVAGESYEQAMFMTELERLRDPSHAVSRSPSAMRVMVLAAGLEIVDERITEQTESLAEWMPTAEFPADRVEKVKTFVKKFGHETGMDFKPNGDDYLFTRRRIMLLAERAGSPR